MGKLGLRYPPASSVDRDSHAARVALLAEDCADLPPEWLDAAAREWAKTEPFMPRACELRDAAKKVGFVLTPPSRTIAAPMPESVPTPEGPPLTDDEIRALPIPLLAMAIKLGEVDEGRAAELRGDKVGTRYRADGSRYSVTA